LFGEERGATSVEDLVCVDVEELLVETDAPEVAFREGRGGGLVAAGGVQEGGLVGLDFVRSAIGGGIEGFNLIS